MAAATPLIIGSAGLDPEPFGRVGWRLGCLSPSRRRLPRSGCGYCFSKTPELDSNFLFGDVSIGVIYCADQAEMLAADDGDPTTIAEIHALDDLWDNPNDNPDNE